MAKSTKAVDDRSVAVSAVVVHRFAVVVAMADADFVVVADFVLDSVAAFAGADAV